MMRSFFYLYLLFTAQTKRLVLEKLKDGQLNFKELYPKWRDDGQIADLAVRLDLGNMAWCGECFREDLEFIIKAYSYWNIEIIPTTIRDAYFAFLCVDAKTPISKRFFWGQAIVKFFKRPDIEFEAERTLAEKLFSECASGASWFVSDDNEASLELLKRSYPSFSEESYRQALAITRHRSMKGPPDWIW